MAVGWMKTGALPTVYGLFGSMGGAIGLVLMGLAILVTVAMINRWKLLLLVEYVVIGFICGIILPWVWPVITGKLAELGF